MARFPRLTAAMLELGSNNTERAHRVGVSIRTFIKYVVHDQYPEILDRIADNLSLVDAFCADARERRQNPPTDQPPA